MHVLGLYNYIYRRSSHAFLKGQPQNGAKEQEAVYLYLVFLRSAHNRCLVMCESVRHYMVMMVPLKREGEEEEGEEEEEEEGEPH